MRTPHPLPALLTLLLTGLFAAGCQAPPVRPAGAAAPAVEASVRQFLADVAQGVSRDGPAAWQHYFAPRPEFFMASDGVLAFRDGTAAIVGISAAAREIRHIELKWGADARVDVLGPDLAVVGLTWSEVRDLADGTRVADDGYFTAVVERREGTWKFRDAHWSQPLPGR
jgi:Domain of unknown function (DUF4440)